MHGASKELILGTPEASSCLARPGAKGVMRSPPWIADQGALALEVRARAIARIAVPSNGLAADARPLDARGVAAKKLERMAMGPRPGGFACNSR
eukprot:3762343-Pyramimonas_sp.AAC.1